MIATQEQRDEFLELLKTHCNPDWINEDIYPEKRKGHVRELYITLSHAHYDRVSAVIFEFEGSPSRNCIFFHLPNLLIINDHQFKSESKQFEFAKLINDFLKKHGLIDEHGLTYIN